MSTIQLNLLPDVKLEFYKTQKTKRFVFSLVFLISAVAVGLMLISFLIANVVQKKALADVDKDINQYSDQLQKTPDLEKILTIQNQLSALPGLHQQKHVLSRLFSYLPSITPANVSIGRLTLDAAANTMTINGIANTVETVNKFVDTLKFTTFNTGDANSKQPAFKSVVLDTIGRDDKGASYTVSVSFDPALFVPGNNINIVVPKAATTRSITESPQAIFDGQTGQPPADNKQGGQ